MDEDENSQLSNEFKFILYVSFANEKEALGLELMDGLEKINKKLNLNNFELIKRFSNQRGERWNDQFIKKEINKYKEGDLRKVWVCGPPLMNETFEKTLMDIPFVSQISEIL